MEENNREEKLKAQISEDIKKLAEPLKAIHSFLFALITTIYFIASAILLAVVIFKAFEDWYMYLLMEIIIFSFLMLYFGANINQKMFFSCFFYILCIFLIIFFIWSISDKILFHKETGSLYIPVIIFFLCTGLLTAHLVLSFFKRFKQKIR